MVLMKLARLIYMTTSPLVQDAKSLAAKDLNIKKRNPTIEDFHLYQRQTK
jgi:hypothetical protein